MSNIVAAELQSDTPDVLAARWSAILRRPISTVAGGELRIALDNATLRFVKQSDGKGEVLGGIDLKASDRDATLAAAKAAGLEVQDNTVQACGMRIRLV